MSSIVPPAPDERTQELINALKDHPEVLVIDRMYNRAETWSMEQYCNTRELSTVYGQLELVLDDKSLPYKFHSFLVKLEDGIITSCWGLPSIIVRPSSIGFKIL